MAIGDTFITVCAGAFCGSIIAGGGTLMADYINDKRKSKRSINTCADAVVGLAEVGLDLIGLGLSLTRNMTIGATVGAVVFMWYNNIR